MKSAHYIRTIVFVSLLTLVAALSVCCQSEAESGEHLIYIERYDKLQANYALYKNKAAFQRMKKNYPQETAILYENVLSLGHREDSSMEHQLYKFYSDTTLQRLMQDVEKKFPDMAYIEDSLNMAFVNMKQLLPTLRIPTVYTQISALNQSIVVSDSIVGISLDKYLGENYPLYAQYYYPYQRRTMNASRIVPDVLFYYLCSEYANKLSSKTFAERLVNIGKIQWLVRKACGYKDWGETMDYTKEECEWMENNEIKVWYYLLNNRLLTKKASSEHEWMGGEYLKNYFHTNVPSFMPMWMGARLVGNYMKQNKDITATELLNCDYKRIYQTAGLLL